MPHPTTPLPHAPHPRGCSMQNNQPLPPPYSVAKTVDGWTVSGPHAQTTDENLHQGTASSIYVIQQGSDACIIDTGRFDPSYKALTDILEKNGLRVRYIILTHDHYDHVGNAHRVREAFGGQIIAHALDRPLLENPLSLYEEDIMRRWYGSSVHEAWADMGFSRPTIDKMRAGAKLHFNEPVAVDRYCSEEISLDLAGLELRLLHTPGHSPGSLSVHVPSSNSVYTGDLTFWINPCRPYPIGNALNCLKSLERVAALEPAYCGHGHYRGVESPALWLRELIDRHHRLRDDILANLREPGTIAELRDKIFPPHPFDSFPLIPENSIQSWLIGLMQDRRVTRIPREDLPSLWQKIV